MLTWLLRGHVGLLLVVEAILGLLLLLTVQIERVNVIVEAIGVDLNETFANAGLVGAWYLDRGLLQVNLLAVHLVHVVVHARIVSEAAVLVQSHKLLLPVLIDRAVGFLVQESLSIELTSI